MRFRRDVLQTSSLVVLLLGLTALSGPAGGEVVTGELGSPGATTTITGKQIPPPPAAFGGVIKEKASESKPWWAPRVVPPKGAPNVLLIMTDDAGFGAPGTFGGVIPLLVMPSVVVELLLGLSPGTPSGVTVSRVAGVALLALSVACWLAREDAASRAAKGLVAAMLLYNIAVVAVLVLAWTSSGRGGIGFWPVVLAHAALAAWCVVALSAGNEEKRS